MSIKVEQLSKQYGSQWAVKDLSFEVPVGQVVGFLGPNGAGKSTTMKMLTGYVQPTAGQAFVLEHNVQEAPLLAKQRIGYLPEHNPLYLDMYVHEYLRFMGRLQGLRGEGLRARIEAVITETGLTPEQHKRLGQLSKGFRQRVGLAQALLHEPDILILDEPTSGLDPNQVQDIRALIRKLGEEKTVLFSSHIMQEVEAVASRVLILNHGQLVEDRLLDGTATPQPTLTLRLEVELEGEAQVALPLAELQATYPGLAYKVVSPTLYLLEVPEAHDRPLRKQLPAWLAGKQATLLALGVEATSLEDLFRQVTQQPGK